MNSRFVLIIIKLFKASMIINIKVTTYTIENGSENLLNLQYLILSVIICFAYDDKNNI